MRAGWLYLQIPISNSGKMQEHCQNTEHKLYIIIRYMHMIIIVDNWYLGIYVEGKANYIRKTDIRMGKCLCT